MKNIELIGEIGTNHNGDFNTAIQLIDMAYAAGLDTVKFQIYDAEDIVSPLVKSELYGIKDKNLLWKDYINEKLITPKTWLPELVSYAKELNMGVLATPHSLKNAEICLNAGIERLKIASMDCNYYPFIKELANLQVPLLLSTGMATQIEIMKTVEIIKSKSVHLSLFHCTATYPTKYEEANLNFLNFLKNLKPDSLGLSDHSTNDDLIIMSVIYGVDIIEKHITLDNKQHGPDHSFALAFDACKSWKIAVENALKSMGEYDKKMSERELRNRIAYRRVPILIKDKQAGDKLEPDDFVFARPPKLDGDFVTPDNYELFIGLKLSKSIQKGNALEVNYFK